MRAARSWSHLHLERVVGSLTVIVLVRNGAEGRWSRGIAAAQRVAGDRSACRRRLDILVQTIHQNVRTARPGVSPGCQHNVSKNLALQVQVELLHSSLLEVKVLGVQRAGERGDGRGALHGPDHATRQVLQENALHAAIDCGVEIPAIREAVEVVRFGEVGRVLPQPLPALIPRGIMEDRVSATDRCVLTLEWLPRETDARLDRGFVDLNSNIRSGGNTEVAAR